MAARGIRNNNPLNIIANGIEWRGLAAPSEMTPEQRAEQKFAVFRTPEMGIRAGVLILQSYRRRNLDTVAEIISTWAPPSDNNQTEAYAKAVADAIGVQVDDVIDTTDSAVLLGLVKAMVKFENNEQPYTDETIMAGIIVGLTRADPKPIDDRSDEVKGQVRHGVSFGAGVAASIAFAAALGLITPEDAGTLTEASATLLSEENLAALAAVAAILGQAWSMLSSWKSKAKG